VAEGVALKEIAEKLGVTYTNVNRHASEVGPELRGLREAA
jgi:DNA-directed RNA polymerase specialized sigma24 family protein